MKLDSHRGSTARGAGRNARATGRFRKFPTLLACVAALSAATFALAITWAITAQAQQQASVPVGTVYAEKRPIAQTRDFVGRVEAIDRVEVRARVKGYLDAVLFKEGDIVKKGDPLYRIEKSLFQADVDQAKGNLERSKSAKVLTEIQLQRAQDLMDKNAGTVVARDQARAADQQAEGAIMSDQANLDTSNINLGYTDITSPIAGKVSKTNVTVGNVVGPDSGVLTTIVSQDPMYVSFPVSQRELLQAQLAGKLNNTNDVKIKINIRFADGTTYKEAGIVNFFDVSVDRATDTVLVRAIMPNPDGVLIDGQLVSVSVQAGAPQEKVVVPQAALIADQQGVYVFVVEDGKAAIKRVKVVGEIGSNSIVDSGLSGGEQVIVEGIQSVRPGQAVQASPLPAAVQGN
jgi:membrane fusion protein, multidrug efflux system